MDRRHGLVGEDMDRFTAKESSTLIEALQLMFPQSSTNKLRKMLSGSRVSVNGEIQHRAKHEIAQGDEVALGTKAMETVPKNKRPPTHDPRLKILFEDESMLVVVKPAHILSVATDKLEITTLHSWCVEHLRHENPKAWAYIVHRLDRETSGIMVLAKTKTAKEALQEQFAQREVHRTYMALVEGDLEPPQGTVRTWLLEDKNLNVKAVNARHPQGKEAISHYNTVSVEPNGTLVEVMIETGRRHQIRMAMQHLNAPIVGDGRHGSTTNPHQRLMLHAHALEFLHPDTDDPVRFEAPIPPSFRSKAPEIHDEHTT